MAETDRAVPVRARTNPVAATISGPELAEALRTLAGKTRVIPLAEYMRLDGLLKKRTFSLYRQAILGGMTREMLDEIGKPQSHSQETYSTARQYVKNIVFEMEQSAGIPIEVIFIIAMFSVVKRRVSVGDPARSIDEPSEDIGENVENGETRAPGLPV